MIDSEFQGPAGARLNCEVKHLILDYISKSYAIQQVDSSLSHGGIDDTRNRTGKFRTINSDAQSLFGSSLSLRVCPCNSQIRQSCISRLHSFENLLFRREKWFRLNLLKSSNINLVSRLRQLTVIPNKKNEGRSRRRSRGGGVTFEPGGGITSSTFSFSASPSTLSLAARTIAWLITPLILTSFKLHTQTTSLFCISSNGIYLTKPEHTIRTFSSPTSICET